MMQDLNDLRFFAAVVAHKGFSAGARALGVPKSRLSRRVALLEEALGLRLLERSTRRVTLTEVGERVFEHARSALLEAEAVEELALRLQAEPRGLVRMSCPSGLTPLLAPHMAGFLAQHPMLRLQCLTTNRRVDLVEEGVDIALRVREQLDTDPLLQLRRIGVSRRLLVASPDLIARMGALTHPAELGGAPLLDLHEAARPNTWRLVGPGGQVELVTIEPRLSAGAFEPLLFAARAGLGVALLPEQNCREDLASGTLTRVMPDWSGEDGIVHLVFTSRRGMLPGVRAVIEFVVQALQGRERG